MQENCGKVKNPRVPKHPGIKYQIYPTVEVELFMIFLPALNDYFIAAAAASQ